MKINYLLIDIIEKKIISVSVDTPINFTNYTYANELHTNYNNNNNNNIK